MSLVVLFGASLLAAPNALNQSGHEIRFPLREETIFYEVSGKVVRTYLGGRTAPEVRSGQLEGRYRVQLSRSQGGWTLTGVSEDCVLTSDGKSLSPAENAAAKLGKWTVRLDSKDVSYTWDDKPRPPFVLSLPFWPVGWMPIVPESPLRIGDWTIAVFRLPLQSFLEDDPIGVASLPIKYVFDGPVPGEPPRFRFNVQTTREFDEKVSHPEDPDLKLTGRIQISGTIEVNRRDGRVESAVLRWIADIGLEGPRYSFGFSKCRLNASVNLSRLR